MLLGEGGRRDQAHTAARRASTGWGQRTVLEGAEGERTREASKPRPPHVIIHVYKTEKEKEQRANHRGKKKGTAESRRSAGTRKLSRPACTRTGDRGVRAATLVSTKRATRAVLRGAGRAKEVSLSPTHAALPVGDLGSTALPLPTAPTQRRKQKACSSTRVLRALPFNRSRREDAKEGSLGAPAHRVCVSCVCVCVCVSLSFALIRVSEAAHQACATDTSLKLSSPCPVTLKARQKGCGKAMCCGRLKLDERGMA